MRLIIAILLIGSALVLNGLKAQNSLYLKGVCSLTQKNYKRRSNSIYADSLVSVTKMRFSRKGLKTEEKRYTPNGILQYCYIYLYNDSNLCIKIEELDGSGKIISKDTAFWNNQGQFVSLMTSQDIPEWDCLSEVISCKKDRNGYITEKVRYVNRDKKYQLLKQKIKYEFW